MLHIKETWRKYFGKILVFCLLDLSSDKKNSENETMKMRKEIITEEGQTNVKVKI